MEPFSLVNIQHKDGPQPYYSFSVQWNIVGAMFDPVTTIGWRYFPEKDIMSTPSIKTGRRFINTHSISPARYNSIKDAIKKVIAR